MKKVILAVALAGFLIGCGGGSGGESNDTTNTDNNSKKIQSQNITIDKLKTDKNGKIGSIETQAPANGVAVSKNALFVAEGANGVEIIKIGYSDNVATELIYKIENIDAKKVTLSDDEQTLYVEKSNGKVSIIDIRNLSEPKIIGEKPRSQTNIDVITKNGTYQYIPKGEDGLEVWSVANPSNKEKLSTMKSSNAYDIVLIDDDKKALIATGAVGIKLLNLDNPKYPNPVSDYRIPGSKVTSLSLNPTDEILFAATGDKGILVFNLDILLNKMGY